MKSGLSVFVLLLALCSIASADPCIPGTLESYLALDPINGCTIGIARFSAFELGFLLPGAKAISAADIAVTPFGAVNSHGLDFAVNAVAGPGEILQQTIGYRVDFPSSAPVIADLRMIGSTASVGAANTVVEELCLGGVFFGFGLFCEDPDTFTTLPTQTLITVDIGVDQSLAESAVLPPLKTLGVFTDIVVDAGVSGSAALTSAQNQFTVVPEPATIGSLATIVAGLWLCSRRRKTQ